MIQTRLRNFRISPSQFSFLYDSCKRCFYDTVRHGFARPQSFSEHFTAADRAMRQALADRDVIDLGVGPTLRVVALGQWVESQPIAFENHGVSLSFFGQYDALTKTVDDELFLVDFKTTTLDDSKLMKYRRALACYVTAVERPKAYTRNTPAYVDGMALLVFNPQKFDLDAKEKRSGIYGPTRWIELPRRDDLFNQFLDKVAELLANPLPPPQGADCAICSLRFTNNIDELKPVGQQQPLPFNT